MATTEELLAAALKQNQELLNQVKEFWDWCEATNPYGNNRLSKAINYALDQRTALDQVLKYGEIDFTNNAAERDVKRFVIGRKNWLFSTSPGGAKANAIWMTLIQSAEANGINGRDYLEYLLNTMSQLPTFAKEVQLEACLPWNYQPKPELITV